MRNYWLITLLMLTGCIPPPTYAPAPLPGASSPPLVYKTRVLETPSREWCEKNVPQEGRPQWLITNEYSQLCPEQVVAVSLMRPTTPLSPPPLPSPPLYTPLPVPPSPENYRVPPSKGRRTTMVARKTPARPRRTMASKVPAGPRTVAIATKTPAESQTTALNAPTVESVSDPTPPKAVAGQCSNGQIWVNSYTREDGTLVSGHCKPQQPAKIAPSLKKALAGHCDSGQIWVKPYTREDGMLVDGHCKHRGKTSYNRKDNTPVTSDHGKKIPNEPQMTPSNTRAVRPHTSTGHCGSDQTWIKPYTRKNGTPVSGYCKHRRKKIKATVRIHYGSETRVKSYIRKDGTRVKGYTRKKRTK